jgi:hypothetical protein
MRRYSLKKPKGPTYLRPPQFLGFGEDYAAFGTYRCNEVKSRDDCSYEYSTSLLMLAPLAHRINVLIFSLSKLPLVVRSEWSGAVPFLNECHFVTRTSIFLVVA